MCARAEEKWDRSRAALLVLLKLHEEPAVGDDLVAGFQTGGDFELVRDARTERDAPALETAVGPHCVNEREILVVAQAKHHERELKASGDDLLGQVLLDVQNSYSTATTAWRQAVYLRDELLPEAQAAYKAASTSYSLGGSSALDLLDAKGALLDAERQYTDALGAANDARADLERAIGAPLPASSASAISAVSPATPHEK